MNGFLKEVASSIISTYGDDISNLNIVFSSRRAQRYFNIELSKTNCRSKPHYTTIDELITSFCTDLKQAEKLKLLTSLYNIYNQFYPTENFEKFYSFGQLLLTDFDTIDRYMVDAQELYSIVSDTMTLESGADDPAHRAAVDFWRTFQHSKAEMHEQQEFLQIWQSLYQIYFQYKIGLQNEGIAYPGMIYRSVAEKLPKEGQIISGKYIFIGLNALSNSEQAILNYFQKSKSATFYWDYNQRWIDDETAEAGYFIRKNLQLFPQADGFDYSERSNDDVKLKVIDTPSDIMQCKVVSNELIEIASLQNGAIDSETAVILTDEKLLIPLLHSIPETVEKFNISMGYPLNSTLAYLFIERLISLQNRSRNNSDSGLAEFYHTDVIQLLIHPYIANSDLAAELEGMQIFYFSASYLTEKIETHSVLWHKVGRVYQNLQSYLFDVIDLILGEIDVEKEQQFLLTIKSTLAKLSDTINNCNIELSNSLYTSLMFGELAAQGIDFEGHSGEGVQITGILESRSLDFKNIILLSMSDDNFPSSRSVSSYIPQRLREGYGMPSITEHSAIWSYYFYRLLQCADNITMIYCSAADNSNSGEPSRYIYQLQYTTAYNIEFKSVIINALCGMRKRNIEITKTPQDIALIRGRSYSPSALSRYLRCTLSFYFADIAQITSPDSGEEVISPLDTGNALHKIMQTLYKPFVGKMDAKSLICDIDKSLIHNAIERYMASNLSSKIEINQGSAHILEATLQRMVENIVHYDANVSANFELLALEQPIAGVIDGVKIGGIVDRLDRMEDGTIRIVDYKSGADKTDFTSVEELVSDDPKGQNNAALQTLIYGVMVGRQYRADTSMSLYTARKMSVKNFSPLLIMGGEKIDKITVELGAEIDAHISATLAAIGDQNTSFRQTLFPDKVCSRCPYAAICRR